MARLFPTVAAAFLYATALQAAPEFNRDIRPILSDRCYSCHGPDSNNRKAGLRLDTEADAKRAAIIPGDATKSPLIKRVSTANKALRMPPAYAGHEPLTPKQIATLQSWIAAGAAYQSHWAFIPPKRAAEGAGIDDFINRKLQAENLKPSPEADKRTLIRRVTLDLTGVPPTPEEVAAFLNDTHPKAYEHVVDRLLKSTRYAERMAIRWLEAARYSDTNGYQTDGPRTMWPWRDWVINAFHTDMPYDRFTIEQIAGDLLPNATPAQKIATAFHRNHRTSAEGGIVDEEFRVEYVADRTETTGTVWLGLTVGCARCHDHKFDPIKQKDFYSLFAFFNNVPERGFVWNFGNEEPIMQAPSPAQQRRLDELDAAIKQSEQRLSAMKPQLQKAQAKWERTLQPNFDWQVNKDQKLHLPENREFDGVTFHDAGSAGPVFDYRDPFTLATWVKPQAQTGAILSRGDDYVEGQQHGLYIMEGKLRLHVTFRWTDLAMRVETAEPLPQDAWSHVAVTYDGNMRAAGVRMYVNGKAQQLKVLFDQLLWPMDTKKHPWRVGAGGGLRFKGAVGDVRVYSRELAPREVSALSIREPVGALAALRSNTRTTAQKHKLELCFYETNPIPEFAKLDAALAERKAFAASVPTVMVMKERDEPRKTFLLKRGAYDAPGEEVSPSVPSFLHALPSDAPKNRLGLARWLVDRNNPLTARATVNRFWAMFFGTGLVKTMEDFGSQGEMPVHQDLLDWLAVDFMESGWSVKHTLKAIVMSAAYRQSSNLTPELLQRDPENRLFARGPRFRLSAEMIRDSALAASGLLVDKVGGPPVNPYQPAGLWQELQGGKGYKEDEGEGLYRRSLYSYWRRTVAPPNMVAFDAPTRETCVVRENRTNTPMQALALMNDVVYVEAARKLAERMILESGEDASARIGRGYQLVLARSPKASEANTVRKALDRLTAFYETNPNDANALLAQGKSPRDPKIPASELAAYTGIASLILNLDEAVTKQ